jgi:hypothetical protein
MMRGKTISAREKTPPGGGRDEQGRDALRRAMMSCLRLFEGSYTAFRVATEIQGVGPERDVTGRVRLFTCVIKEWLAAPRAWLVCTHRDAHPRLG